MEEDAIAYTDDNLVLRFSSEMENNEQFSGDTASMIHSSKSIMVLGRRMNSKNFIRGTLIVICLLSLVVLVLAIVIGRNTCAKQPEKICEIACSSSDCQILSSRRDLIKNNSMPTCKNFYIHSCGHYERTLTNQPGGDKDKIWTINQEITEANHAKFINYLRQPLIDQSIEEPIIKKIRSFFQACSDDTDYGKADIVDYLKKIFPNFKDMDHIDDVILSDWNSTQVWATMQWNFSIGAFVKIGFTSSYSFKAFLFDPEDINILSGLNSSQQAQMEPAYRKYVETVMGNLVNTKDSNFSMDIFVKDVLTIQRDILSTMKINKDNSLSEYTSISIKSLTDKAPQIEWLQFFHDFLPNVVSNETHIYVSNLNYIVTISKYFAKNKRSSYYHYVVWRLIEYYSKLGTIEYRTAYQSFVDTAASIIPDSPSFKQYSAKLTYPRIYTCYNLAWQYFPEALNSIFTQKFLPNNTRNSLVKLHKSLNDMILNSNNPQAWMKALKKAITKELSIKGSVDMNKINYYYQDLTIKGKFSTDVLFLMSFRRIQWINIIHGKIESPVVGTESVLTAKYPYYNVQNDMIIIQSGVLQLPYFSAADATDSWLWGRLGSHIMKAYLTSINESYWKSEELLNTRKCFANQLSLQKAGPFYINSKAVYVDITVDESSPKLKDFLIDYLSVLLSVQIISDSVVVNKSETSKTESLKDFFYAYSQMQCETAPSSDLYHEAQKYSLVKEILVNNVLSQLKIFREIQTCPAQFNEMRAKLCYNL